MFSVSELKIQLGQAELIEQQQASAPNDRYSLNAHYSAMDRTTSILFQLQNHPDLTNSDYEQIFGPKAGDMPQLGNC